MYGFIGWVRYITHGRVDLEVTLSCQLTQFLSCIGSYSSVWILTAMTIEKSFNVLFPLKAKKICTVKSAKIVCAFIITFWALVYSHILFVYRKHEDDVNGYCQFDFDKVPLNFPHVYAIVDLIIYSFLPSCLIFIANITIITKLISAKYHSNDQINNTLSKVSVSTSIMLVTISVAFIILTLPSCIIYTMYMMGKITNDKILFTAGIPYVMNHSINAALLTLIAPRFRAEMKLFFMRHCCYKGARVEPLSLHGTTSSVVKSSENPGVKHENGSSFK